MKQLVTIVEANDFSIEKSVSFLNEEYLNARVGSSNEIGRLFGHITSYRNGVIGLLGGSPINLEWGAFGEFSMTAQFDEQNEVPTLANIVEKWNLCSQALKSILSTVSEDTLSQKAPFPLPISDDTMDGFVSFILFHESYHIGQITLIAKEVTGKTIFGDSE